MKYKVCILAAGVGSRMGKFAESIHKSLLPVNNKAVLTHIFEKFDHDVEIVLAVGHKSDLVKQFVSVAHPERRVQFVEIDKYVGPGTGPGYSLRKCAPYLQCPFVFYASDTLVLEPVPEPARNWFGIAPVRDPENYCSVKLRGGLVSEIDDKIKSKNKFAFIGLAGIYDYKEFFSSLEEDNRHIGGEIQVSNGFRALLEKELTSIGFSWFDTGTLENYRQARQHLSGTEEKFDFSKSNEFVYFTNNLVIKYNEDSESTRKKVLRSSLLAGLGPHILNSTKNFFSYKKIPGNVAYDTLNDDLVDNLLNFAEVKLWPLPEELEVDQEKFSRACEKFYKEKTFQRIDDFYRKTSVKDGHVKINGVDIPPLGPMLRELDWKGICEGKPARIHGDFQFDNIVCGDEEFSVIDWRQDFGGLIECGDLYYDLAKLLGGSIISYKDIKKGEFKFSLTNHEAFYSYKISNELVDARMVVEEFITKHGYSLSKVRNLTALIFLNMSPLHNDPFDHLLYFMGRKLLHQERGRAAI